MRGQESGESANFENAEQIRPANLATLGAWPAPFGEWPLN